MGKRQYTAEYKAKTVFKILVMEKSISELCGERIVDALLSERAV